ncbi:MAG: outer membrane protein transport protein [Candidatus Delongbacteria bacterium]|nr:outer membrane protein transport protein [Candidatus Delongbacteria bacterium]
MKKSLQLILFLAIAIGAFANGLSLNSVGVRAFGMGGAFVGLADDASAIHWNPAGMIGQKNSAMLFMTDVVPMASYTNYGINVDAETDLNHYISPNLFGVYNYKDFAFGFGAYVPAGLGVEWNTLAGMAALNGTLGANAEWMSKIFAIDFSPAVAYKLTDNIYLGCAVNIYYSMMELKRPEDMNGDRIFDTQTSFDISGLGYGSVLSLKLTNDLLDFGLTYKTPIMVDYDGTMNIDLPGYGDYDMEFHIEWPTWIGAGIAVKPYDGLKVVFDVQYTNWNEMTTLVADVDVIGEKEMHLYWHDAVQYRLGAEYVINKEYTVRGGYYLDPAPCGDATVNILFPSLTNHAATGGVSYTHRDFTVDFGMEYLISMSRQIDQELYNMSGSHKMDIFAFSLGGSYFIPVR